MAFRHVSSTFLAQFANPTNDVGRNGPARKSFMALCRCPAVLALLVMSKSSCSQTLEGAFKSQISDGQGTAASCARAHRASDIRWAGAQSCPSGPLYPHELLMAIEAARLRQAGPHLSGTRWPPPAA